MPGSPRKPKTPTKWVHPSQVMKLHKEKLKQKALQERIKSPSIPNSKGRFVSDESFSKFDQLISSKRKNPFLSDRPGPKRARNESYFTQDESTDQTIFKLLHSTTISTNNTESDFGSVNLNKSEKQMNSNEKVEVVKVKPVKWIPIDWSLKTKIRLLSSQCFSYSSKLNLSEEASGLTAFARCVEKGNSTNLNESQNAKFHRCCLYWQQPTLPWLRLFPRTTGKSTSSNNIMSNSTIRESLQGVWTDSLRSLLQLIRTQQCPYFYVCANSFTVLFRAGGFCGQSEMNALITPTTRGFRQLLKQEDIEYEMPLQKSSDVNLTENPTSAHTTVNVKSTEKIDEDAAPDEKWMESMGINAEEIKRINNIQAQIEQKTECKVDNSEQSLILIKGSEVHALFNFLINCKSAISSTGPLAGIPPTLIAPVAFLGATLNSLKVRESKVLVNSKSYYSIEISGPILPEFIHNLCLINPPVQSFTATFSNVFSTLPFNKVKSCEVNSMDSTKTNTVFTVTCLSDCGLNPAVLKTFCAPDNVNSVTTVECLKYSSDSETYTWT